MISRIDCAKIVDRLILSNDYNISFARFKTANIIVDALGSTSGCNGNLVDPFLKKRKLFRLNHITCIPLKTSDCDYFLLSTLF